MFVQFFATDAFLNKKWRYYGLKVIEYYSYTQEERNNPDLGLKSEHTLLILSLTRLFRLCQEPDVHRVPDCDQLHHPQCRSFWRGPGS